MDHYELLFLLEAMINGLLFGGEVLLGLGPRVLWFRL